MALCFCCRSWEGSDELGRCGLCNAAGCLPGLGCEAEAASNELDAELEDLRDAWRDVVGDD